MEHMTENELLEWEDRHDEITSWEDTWASLIFVFLVIAGVLALLGKGTLALWFFGAVVIFFIALGVCERRHQALHEEMGVIGE